MKNKDYLKLQKKYQSASNLFDKKLLKIKFKECGEEFSDLKLLAKKQKVKIVFTNKDNYLRAGVAQALLKAAEYFNKMGYTLKVESTYRSLEEQKQRFTARYLEMKNKFPEKTKDELLQAANTFTAGVPIFAAHTAGAGVDVTLLDLQNNPLEFGVPYKFGGIESITDYPHLSKKVKSNRKLLNDSLEKFGFINYPFEYWHYNIGDVCAAYIKHQRFAKYKPVNYKIKENRMTYMEDDKELYTHFKINV